MLKSRKSLEKIVKKQATVVKAKNDIAKNTFQKSKESSQSSDVCMCQKVCKVLPAANNLECQPSQESRKSRDRQRSNGRQRPSSSRGRNNSRSNSEKKYAISSRHTKEATSVASLGTPINIKMTNSLYHAECIDYDSIDDVIFAEAIKKKATAEKLLDTLDIANKGMSRQPINISSNIYPNVSSEPHGQENTMNVFSNDSIDSRDLNYNNKDKLKETNYTQNNAKKITPLNNIKDNKSNNANVNYDVHKIFEKKGKPAKTTQITGFWHKKPVNNNTKENNIHETNYGAISKNQNANPNKDENQHPKKHNNKNEDVPIEKTNICIYISSDGKKSELAIDPDDIKLLLKWKAEKKCRNQPINSTENLLMKEFQESKVHMCRSKAALKKPIQHQTCQTESSSDDSSTGGENNPHYPQCSENVTSDSTSDIPIHVDCNCDCGGTSAMPDGNNYQIPNHTYYGNGFQNTNNRSCGNGFPNANNSWLKCTPNCCWYSYTNCTQWNPLNNPNFNNMSNMNTNYE